MISQELELERIEVFAGLVVMSAVTVIVRRIEAEQSPAEPIEVEAVV